MLDFIISNTLYVLGIVFCFGLVIFVHEFGHFFVAKKSGVKVDQFAFGFGKKIFGFQWGETEYRVNWIPLGGYVKMAGEFPEDYEGPVAEGREKAPSSGQGEADHSRDFMALTWYRRIPIVLAGPFMNYVLAVVVFFSMFLIWGKPTQIDKAIVGDLLPGKPAESAGLIKGDQILSVDGTFVDTFTSLAELIQVRASQPTTMMILREEREFEITLTPQLDEKRGVGLIGVAPPIEDQKMGPLKAFTGALHQCWMISYISLYQLGRSVIKWEKPDVAGPLGIGHVIVKAVESGWRDFWFLIGLISVALGLINLFPIPLVDGGHLVYYLIEGIQGKPVSPKFMGRANAVGAAILLTLVIFATSNDIKRIWFNKDKPVQQEVEE